MGKVADGNLVGALLIDLSKAFDSINHSQLLQELGKIGCSKLAISWFSSFLQDRIQRVKIGSAVSTWSPVSKGVPQGSPLSPLLFNIAVRLLPHSVDTEVFQFADDLTNAVADKNADNLALKLQDSYSTIKSFCADKNLSINVDKT